MNWRLLAKTERNPPEASEGVAAGDPYTSNLGKVEYSGEEQAPIRAMASFNDDRNLQPFLGAIDDL